MSDNAVFALLIMFVAVTIMCIAACGTAFSITQEKEITARQSKQAVESNFELAYKLWAEDRPRPVQAFPDWKKEHAMELSSGVLVVKLKGARRHDEVRRLGQGLGLDAVLGELGDANSGDAIGSTQK